MKMVGEKQKRAIRRPKAAARRAVDSVVHGARLHGTREIVPFVSLVGHIPQVDFIIPQVGLEHTLRITQSLERCQTP